MSVRTILGGGLVLALAAGLWVWSSGVEQVVQLGPADGRDLPAQDTGRVQVGDVAPDFSLLAYSGDTLTLSDYRGESNVVLSFYRGHW